MKAYIESFLPPASRKRIFAEKIVRMSEPEILLSRREQYPSEVPNEAKLFLLAAIDTQVTWFEHLVCAVGARGELWVLATGTIDGRIETDAQAMYAEVDQLLARQWTRKPMAALMQIIAVSAGLRRSCNPGGLSPLQGTGSGDVGLPRFT